MHTISKEQIKQTMKAVQCGVAEIENITDEEYDFLKSTKDMLQGLLAQPEQKTNRFFHERAQLEQAAEIAELRAKLAEVMPLAMFGARVLTTDEHPDDIAHEYKFLMLDVDEFSGTYILEPNIEATIERILKD
jgi:hypothetical protein